MPEPIRTPGALLRFRRFEFQTRVRNRLVGSRNGIDDEVIDFALLLRLHPIIGIELAVGGRATRNEVRDLACDVGDFEFFDAPSTALTGEQIRPRGFDTAADGSDETHSCNDDTAHLVFLMCRLAHLQYGIGHMKGAGCPAPL